MRYSCSTLALVLAAAGLAAAAHAAEGRFVHPADTNKDQGIDKAEWVAHGLPEAAFAKADADGNGKVNGPEFVTWHQAANAAVAKESAEKHEH